MPTILSVNVAKSHGIGLKTLQKGEQRQGVGHGWVGTVGDFVAIGKAVAIGVGEGGIGTIDMHFQDVRESVGIRIDFAVAHNIEPRMNIGDTGARRRR